MQPTRELPSSSVFFALTLLAGACAVSAGRADDWPEWLGINRDGEWRETGLVVKFPAGGPEVLWRVPIGTGYSGPAVADGRLLVRGKQHLYCFGSKETKQAAK